MAPDPLLAAKEPPPVFPCPPPCSIIFTVRVGLGVEAGMLRFRCRELLPVGLVGGGVLTVKDIRSCQ